MERQFLLIAASLVLGSFTPAAALAADETEPAPLAWTAGPGTAPIGDDLAEIDISEGYVHLDAEGTRRLMELTENPVSGDELATLAPVADGAGWFLVFEFDDVGFVADDEKDALDADAMLESIRQGNEAANAERRKRGWETLEIVGWQEAPHYDARTNNLSWAVIAEGSQGRSVNRIVKLLGRKGVMTATLVAGPENLVGAVAEVDRLLESYRFRPGQTYAEYLPGSDKLAKYGLTALVVGGAGAALLKSGLLAKLWKPLVVGLAALGAGIKRFFTGGRSSEHDPEKPIA